MTIVELANLLTELVNAQSDVAHESEKDPDANIGRLVAIRNDYRNAVLDEFTLVKQQLDTLLAALEAMLETEDSDTERPPWTFLGVYRNIGCNYCGRLGEDIDSIKHAEDICPIARARAAIAFVKNGRRMLDAPS